VRVGRERFSVRVVTVLDDNNQTQVQCRLIDRVPISNHDHRRALKASQKV
jgi:hypothetical protein